jgi:hypothetical protein
MTMVEPIKQKREIPGIGAIVAALVLLSLLSGCVVYVPYSGAPPRYHYWR